MATQGIEEKQFTSEHVEQVGGEKKEHSDQVSSENGEHVVAFKHAEQGDKFHAMRIDGDEEDHMHEPPMTFSRAMSLLAMGFIWVGSQIPLYLFGAIPPYIYGDIGGLDRWVWFVLGGLLALAGVCPFVGSLADLLGRRYVAMLGATLLVIGTVVATTAKTMDIFIAGMTIVGAGAGIAELTALSVTSELAPTRKRGQYVAILIFTIVPFVPSSLYAQIIAYYSSWRYVGIIVCVWNGIGFFLTVFFYHPPPRINSKGKTKREILREIDFVGGFLSITGMITFMAGMQWGGYQYPWASAHVVAPIVVGAVLLIGFVCWEVWGIGLCQKHISWNQQPMFPGRIKQDPRVLLLTLLITFISGVSFFAAIMFWPTQAFNVYGHDPVMVGLRTFPAGFAIMLGAVIVLYLLTVFRGRNKELMIISSIIMTAGTGALACGTRWNMSTLWGILILGGLGIGGIVVPASVITTIICPDDLIATVSALTLSIRVLGGSVGYCAYYNVFVSKFVENAVKYIGAACYEVGVTDPALIGEVIELTGVSLIDEIAKVPGIAGNQTAWEIVVLAGQIAYAESYVWVYYASIAAGVISIIAACFLGNINKYMDDHVAVVMR